MNAALKATTNNPNVKIVLTTDGARRMGLSAGQVLTADVGRSPVDSNVLVAYNMFDESLRYVGSVLSGPGADEPGWGFAA